MAYKNLKNTYLFYLPHEIQDEIEKIRIKSIKNDIFSEITSELSNDIPPMDVLVSEKPTKYEQLLESTIELITEIISNLTKIETITFIRFAKDEFIIKNYRAPWNDVLFNNYFGDLNLNYETRGHELDSYFERIIPECFELWNVFTTKYLQILTFKERLTYLTYQELLEFKKIIQTKAVFMQ